MTIATDGDVVLIQETPAFMSCLLNDLALAPYSHNAINDAESFLWVMGYLITRYKGPRTDPEEMTAELNSASEVFNSDQESQKQKIQILMHEEKLCEFLKHVSPGFAGLKELMYAWRL